MNISSETLDFYIKNSRKSLDELQKDIKDIKLFNIYPRYTERFH